MSLGVGGIHLARLTKATKVGCNRHGLFLISPYWSTAGGVGPIGIAQLHS